MTDETRNGPPGGDSAGGDDSSRDPSRRRRRRRNAPRRTEGGVEAAEGDSGSADGGERADKGTGQGDAAEAASSAVDERQRWRRGREERQSRRAARRAQARERFDSRRSRARGEGEGAEAQPDAEAPLQGEARAEAGPDAEAPRTETSGLAGGQGRSGRPRPGDGEDNAKARRRRRRRRGPRDGEPVAEGAGEDGPETSEDFARMDADSMDADASDPDADSADMDMVPAPAREARRPEATSRSSRRVDEALLAEAMARASRFRLTPAAAQADDLDAAAGDDDEDTLFRGRPPRQATATKSPLATGLTSILPRDGGRRRPREVTPTELAAQGAEASPLDALDLRDAGDVAERAALDRVAASFFTDEIRVEEMLRAAGERDEDDDELAPRDPGDEHSADEQGAEAGADLEFAFDHPAPEAELPEAPEDDPDPLTFVMEHGDASPVDEREPLTENVLNIVGIKFSGSGRISMYDAGDETYRRGDLVVVESERGVRVGTVAVDSRRQPHAKRALRRILRRPEGEDRQLMERNDERSDWALRGAREVVREMGLPLKVFRAEVSAAGKKVLVYFTSEERVDFRLLVRQLTAKLRSRVEMRQIGVRDEAKMVGGIGSCGRELCCTTWLPEFVPVSIKMAKDQGLVLNPTKVSGQCGRLKCCLVYEQETYAALRKGLPKLGKRVVTEAGEGRVVEVDVLRQRVRVSLGPGEFRVFAGSEVKPLFPSQPQKKQPRK